MLTPLQHINKNLRKGNPHLLEMLSDIGYRLFFPKGILSQGMEANAEAHRINASVGIARNKSKVMFLPSVMKNITLPPEKSLIYASSFGMHALRKKWQDEIYKKNPSLIHCPISLPIITNGITHAISVFSDMWVNANDVVILPKLMWNNYHLIFKTKKNVQIEQYDLFTQEHDFNLHGFEACLKKVAQQNNKIIVMLNFPHNPTGYMITDKESQAIADILTGIAQKGNHVIVGCDDAYFGLFYEAHTSQESLFSKICHRDERLLAVKLDGISKENYAWGLRIGFITYSCCAEEMPKVLDALEQKTAGCIRSDISNVSLLNQSIILNSLQDENYDSEKEENFQILKSRAIKIKAVLKNPKFRNSWDAYPFNAGYFMCLRLKRTNAEVLRIHLLKKYQIGVIAVDNRNLRIAFSCVEENRIEELFDIIDQAIREIQ